MEGRRTQSGLPEPAEDAAQFFLYRVQIGAAMAADLLTPAEIAGLLEPPAPGDDAGLAERVAGALAGAFARDREQGPAARRLQQALGEAFDPPEVLWRRHREVLLAQGPPTRLHAAVASLQIETGWFARLWGKIRG